MVKILSHFFQSTPGLAPIILLVALNTTWQSYGQEIIPSVKGTGEAPAGALDPYYQLSGDIDGGTVVPGPAIVANQIPSAWNALWPENWIGPVANLNQGLPPGRYSYTIDIDLTGFDPATAVVYGDALSDDGGEILLNGQPLNIPTKLFNDFLVDDRFVIRDGLMPGVNELEFRITNTLGTDENGDPVTTPTGLLARLRGLAERDTTPPTVFRYYVYPDEITSVFDESSKGNAGGSNVAYVRVRASDAQSGISKIELKLEDPNPDEAADNDMTVVRNFSPPVKRLNESFPFTFPPTTTEGFWFLDGTVTDAAMNETDLISSYNGPRGINVSFEGCSLDAIPLRTGPFETVDFGHATLDFIGYTNIQNVTEIRLIQEEMDEFDGWDRQLANTDRDIYYNYCALVELRKRMRRGENVDDEYKQRVETLDLLIEELAAKQLRIFNAYKAPIEFEFLRPEYLQLAQLIVQSDRRNAARFTATQAVATYIGFELFFISVFDYLGGAAKVGPLAVIGLFYDLYNISVDYPIIYEILFEENPVFEEYGDRFTEIWAMYTEMLILFDQYTKQLSEYDKLRARF